MFAEPVAADFFVAFGGDSGSRLFFLPPRRFSSQ